LHYDFLQYQTWDYVSEFYADWFSDVSVDEIIDIATTSSGTVHVFRPGHSEHNAQCI
jgi:hypothetical protein